MAISKKVRVGKTTVYFTISPRWRAGSKSRRADLQKAIDKDIHPYHNVSHTRHIGGFASSATRPVGFDLEPISRKVSERAVRRLATAEELKMCDGEGLIVWVMKEAAFKAMRGERQPKTITAVIITAIKKTAKKSLRKMASEMTFSFKSKDSNGLQIYGRGRCLTVNRTIVGIAITKA